MKNDPSVNEIIGENHIDIIADRKAMGLAILLLLLFTGSIIVSRPEVDIVADG